MRPHIAALFAATAVLLVGCASAATGSPSPVASDPLASAPPTASPAPAETPGASPADGPTATPVPSPVPNATPSGGMTDDEAALLAALRIDASVNCTPRRSELPDGARHGIECRPDDPAVARVGIYWFDSGNEAAYAYMTRMAEAGVDVNAGDCYRDIPGDTPWTPGDNEGEPTDPGVFNWENSVLSPDRVGCFLDANGTGNIRATCGQAYVGVLGTGTDLSDLLDWTWRYPDGYEPGTPDAPGICIGDGLIEPDVPEAP